MNVVVLVFGAGGSVWNLKIGSALRKLKVKLLKAGLTVRVWGVETSGRTGARGVVDRWFCIDDAKDTRALFAAIEHSDVQLAVIASPNETHAGLLCALLDKVPYIVVEKPLTEEVLAADLAVSLSEGVSTSTCRGLDHYLGKPSARFVLGMARSGELVRKIGEIEKIHFSMIEARRIDPRRASTLRRGLAFDMAIHGFALLLSLLQLRDLGRIRIDQAAPAEYEGSPIDGETAARIELSVVDGPRASLAIGKAILDDKRVSIVGSKGRIEADFVAGTVTQRRKGQPDVQLFRASDDDAYEVLLEEAIRGACGMPAADGRWLIDLSLARDALKLVERSRVRFEAIERYPAGTVPRVFARRSRLGDAHVEVYRSGGELERAVLREILATEKEALDCHGDFVLVIPGGKSFLAVSRRLLDQEFRSVDLSQWQVFFTDEHGGLHSGEKNNYFLACRDGGWDQLLKRRRLKRSQFHRIPTEKSGRELELEELRQGINAYRKAYAAALGRREGADLLILGLGGDRHTASILPKRGRFDNPLLRSAHPYDVVEYSADVSDGPDRLRASITPAGIAAARRTILLAFGQNKSEAIRDVLTGQIDLAAKPGSIVRLVDGTLMTDTAGAADLPA
jgi:6-phosphogluconolactonase